MANNSVERPSRLIATERVYPCVPTAFTQPEIKSAIIIAEQQLEEMWRCTNKR